MLVALKKNPEVTLKRFISYSLVIHLFLLVPFIIISSGKEYDGEALFARIITLKETSLDGPFDSEGYKVPEDSWITEKTQTTPDYSQTATSENLSDNVSGNAGAIPIGTGFSFPLRREDFIESGMFASSSGQQEKSSIVFEAKNFSHPEYIQRLKEKVDGVWRYPTDAAMRGISGDLYVGFIIKKDGSLSSVEIIRSSGYGSLDGEAIKTIKDAAPYYPLPEDWKHDSLTVKAHFIYAIRAVYVR